MKKVAMIIIVVLLVALFSGCGGGGGNSGGGTGGIKIPGVLEIKAELSGSQITNLHLTIEDLANVQIATTDIAIDPNGFGKARFSQIGQRILKIEAKNANGLAISFKNISVNIPSGLATEIDLTNKWNDLISEIHEGVPDLELTSIPERYYGGNLVGKVAGGNPSEFGTVTYTRTSDGWSIKPSPEIPMASIATNGVWSCRIDTGGLDTTATEILTYLVRQSDKDKIPIVSGGAKPILPFALGYEHAWRK